MLWLIRVHCLFVCAWYGLKTLIHTLVDRGLYCNSWKVLHLLHVFLESSCLAYNLRRSFLVIWFSFCLEYLLLREIRFHCLSGPREYSFEAFACFWVNLYSTFLLSADFRLCFQFFFSLLKPIALLVDWPNNRESEESSRDEWCRETLSFIYLSENWIEKNQGAPRGFQTNWWKCESD